MSTLKHRKDGHRRDTYVQRAELECIAAAMMFPQYLSQVAHLLPSHFSDTRLGRLWQAIREIYADGTDVGSIAVVAQRLQANPDVPPECASVEFIGKLLAMEGVSPILTTYADIIINAYRKRVLGAVARRLADAADNGAAADDIILEYKPLLQEIMSQPALSATRVRSIAIAQVADERLAWLWPRRIPMGSLTLLVGKPGCGKSFIALDLASRISTGTPWPDEQPCERGSVAIMAAEDTPSSIKLRVRAMHADGTRLHLLLSKRDYHEHKPIERPLSLTDVADIEDTLSHIEGLRALIIDPVNAYAPSKLDIYRDNEVRAMLQPISDMARRLNIAVLLISHHRKGGDVSSADAMVMGSVAYVGIARCVYHVQRDPADRSRILLLPGKSNLGIERTGLACRIIGEPAYMSWERSAVTISADEIIERERRRGRPHTARSQAEDWLRDALAAGPRLAADIYREWQQAGGIDRTLRRACDVLGVLRYHTAQGTMWQLPEDETASDAIDDEPF